MAARKKSAHKKVAKKKKPAATRNTAKKKKVAAKKPARKKAATASVARLGKVPFVWKYKTSAQAVGLWVDTLSGGAQVWAANDDGEIFVLDAEGTLDRSYKLPAPVHCLLADEAWKYAGCNDGNVYDLTGRAPRAMYAVDKKAGIDWLEVHRGTLCVSDHKGGLTVVDVEGNVKWQQRDKKAGEGWMVRADVDGVYHGCSDGLRAYDWSGKKLWALPKVLDVRFGWQEAHELVVTAGTVKTGSTWLHVVTKQGKPRLAIQLQGGAGFQPNGAESCASSGERLFASTGGWLFCFGADGTPQWQAATGCGSACTMQLVGDRLYMVTNDGTVACVDVSEAAITRARKGTVPKARVTKAMKVSAAATDIETTSDRSKGVVVECVKEGSKLRVRVVSQGYHDDWFVQFPRDLREEGAQYVVDEIREATQGGFYRALGDIKRLV